MIRTMIRNYRAQLVLPAEQDHLTAQDAAALNRLLIMRRRQESSSQQSMIGRRSIWSRIKPLEDDLESSTA